MKEQSMDEVVVAEYDPSWPVRFVEEAERIRQVIGDNFAATAHIGSTAVPGLAAKPIIDIMVGVHSLGAANASVPAMEALGYSYWREDTMPKRLYFVKGLPPNGPRTHHVHLVERESDFWRTHLLFRDYLRAHPGTAHDYAALKQNLAEQFRSDREAYTDAKSEFIRNVMQKATN